MELLLSLILIVLTSIFAYWYYKWFKYLAFTGLDGPICLPIIGNVFEFLDPDKILLKMAAFHQRYGPIYKLMLGARPIVVIADFDLLEIICRSSMHTHKADFYKFLDRWLGEGLINSNGEKWKQRRRAITPTYHLEVLENFIQTFDCVTNVLLKKLEYETHKEQFNIYPFIKLCALDAISETSMGIPLNAQHNSESTYVKSILELSKLFIKRVFSLHRQNELVYRLTPSYNQEIKHVKVVHDYSMSIIRERRLKLQKEPEVTRRSSNVVIDANGIKRRLSFLDHLLDVVIDDKSLTDEEIREEVDNFLFAGHDTSSAAITFLLYELSKHPEIQDKLLEEQNKIFVSNDSSSLDLQALNAMEYLEMVIKESLRLYPPAPVIGRIFGEDIKYGNIYLKKGLECSLNIFECHRSEKHFSNPEQFDPDRFLNENRSSRHPYVYIPFSAGPRNCIGQKFAMLFMKTIVSKIVRNFELISVNGFSPTLVNQVTLKAKHGVMIKLKKRH